MPEVDPKTGKPLSEGRKRVEALEADNQKLNSRVEALEKKLAEAEEKAKASEKDDWLDE